MMLMFKTKADLDMMLKFKTKAESKLFSLKPNSDLHNLHAKNTDEWTLITMWRPLYHLYTDLGCKT